MGSSSSTHLAPLASARAISTICNCSTDRSRHGVSAAMSNPHSRMMSRVRARSSRQLTSRGAAARNTFSATDRSGTIIECWKTVAIQSRQRIDVAAPRGRARRRTAPRRLSGC